ncbi:hypothetical protein FE810_12100 [Thalassotalea litorea]|uniref:Uncharacterized protein n=1 Tax=Thalassotalea litorea TaxID=2020715 RepID=A0A5R9IM76_9GAMM|nr:hypothetical protein [Thalassotalea litorea]TLU64336.1 hypothetical protein FE810_12100 [Thalassotalea litorea]
MSKYKALDVLGGLSFALFVLFGLLVIYFPDFIFSDASYSQRMHALISKNFPENYFSIIHYISIALITLLSLSLGGLLAGKKVPSFMAQINRSFFRFSAGFGLVLLVMFVTGFFSLNKSELVYLLPLLLVSIYYAGLEKYSSGKTGILVNITGLILYLIFVTLFLLVMESYYFLVINVVQSSIIFEELAVDPEYIFPGAFVNELMYEYYGTNIVLFAGIGGASFLLGRLGLRLLLSTRRSLMMAKLKRQ